MTLTLLTRRCKLPLLILIIFSFYIELPAALIYVVNSESRTLSRIDTDNDQVQNVFAQLGVTPNKVIADENYLWCVNSGDNALQKIDRITGATLANVLIESGCNPWDAVSDGTFIYVTGLFTNKVYKVNMSTHAVEGFAEVGIAPEALCVYNGKLYVTNTGGYQNNYAGSSVSMIDLDSFSVEATVPVSANPQYITEHNGLLHVSCTGNWTSVFGAVCVINPLINEVIQTIPIGGSLGGIWVDNANRGLVGDGNGQYLYRYDAEDFSILNGVANPLPNGGSVVWGDDELTALLVPTWGSNGTVCILHPDLSFWKEYNIGMAPTDMKLWTGETPVTDDYQTPLPQVKVWPNPAQINNTVTFETDKISDGLVSLYNLKGQQVASVPLHKSKATLSPASFKGIFASGFYLYQIKSGHSKQVGKLLLF